MQERYIFFDLDGTLTDPALGITNAIMYALQHFGIVVEDRRELYSFIGPPLKEQFKIVFKLTDEQADEMLRLYRVYYGDKGLFENTVYEGIPTMLSALQQAGFKLVLATSKPAVYAERILEHFDLKQYFTFVSGCELGGARVEKADVIRYALEQLHIQTPAQVCMVGDRSFDVDGARACGIETVGVLYGYGSREELHGAKALASSAEELQGILM